MIGIVGLLGFGAANAGPTEAQPQTITYEEALQGAVKGNAQLASALAARDQAEGGLIAARGQFDPVYSTNFNWRTSTQRQLFQQLGILVDFTAQGWTFTQSLNGNLPSGTSYNVDFNLGRDIVESDSPFGGDDNKNDNFTSSVQATVTQELLRGLRFQFNAQNVVSARTSLEVAELQLEVQRQEALYSAAEAYWGWVYQTELHEIALNSVAVAEEALRIGKLQVETGQLAPVEGTRLEAALVQAQQSALDAANTAEQAANVMLLAMARDPADVVAPGTQPGDVPAVELDPSAAVEVALVQNLDLLVARKNLDQAKIDVANARHSTLPSLSATATGSVGSLRTAACPETTTATPSQTLRPASRAMPSRRWGRWGPRTTSPRLPWGRDFPSRSETEPPEGMWCVPRAFDGNGSKSLPPWSARLGPKSRNKSGAYSRLASGWSSPTPTGDSPKRRYRPKKRWPRPGVPFRKTSWKLAPRWTEPKQKRRKREPTTGSRKRYS